VRWRVAESASELLTGGSLSRVRRCAGEDCTRLFLDTSRGGRRRWCDMSHCGNVAKVRRFRTRHPNAGPSR
jgi:predicted RNA-binding Zn ribbon-like protein